MEEKRRDSVGTPPPATSMDAQAADQPSSRRRGGSLKRKLASVSGVGGSSSNPLMTSSKRQTREKPPDVPFPPIQMNGPCTRARLHPHNSISFDEEAPLKSEIEVAAKMEDSIRVGEALEALEAKIEAEYEAIRVRDANVHVVPVHAGWFMWTEIHPLEEKMVPSFFNGNSDSRNPEIYMAIRNWIMKKFHFNPNEQIELKHLSELTVGELDAQQEVMEFLDYWGLINYHPFPHNEPTVTNADAEKNDAGEMNLLIEKLFQFETVQSWTPVSPRMNREMPTTPSGLFPEYVADELVKPEGPNVEYHCNSCSADCSRKRYHCQKQADFDLCADCFNNGMFGSDMSPSDFILMEPAEAAGASVGNWTDQETLLLLEAIELFRDNWSEIAEHVATKTKAQCILHFVQMPIADAFFSHEDETITTQENAIQVINNTENSAPRDSDTPDKDVPENTEGQVGSTDNQDSSPMEISKPEEVKESENSLEVAENFVLKTLREAFEAVGSLPAPGERCSLADASNPVMTLAAFLARLVDPNIATASIQSLLKFVTGNCSSEQLAARQCLPLEDPPDEKKNLSNSDGAATIAIEHEARKAQGENTEKPEEAPPSIIGSVSKDSTVEDSAKRDSVFEEHIRGASLRTYETDKTESAKEGNGVSARRKSPLVCENRPSNSDIPQKQAEKDKVVASIKELDNGTSAGDTSQSSESMTVEDGISISEKKEADLLPIVNTKTEKEDNTGDRDAKESSSEKKEILSKKKDFDIRKLKQAAVTALSAAAVKAKLLAEQEEDQILRLSTYLIEKELYKLETKLSVFQDIENVVIRVKEHTDKSKLRLFHERAQIIAARIGNRPTSQVLPPNRGAVHNLQNTTLRPFMGMNAPRPPFSRPMPSGNLTSLASASSTGMSQPSVEQMPSFGMK